jgi:hypothetical protein
MANDENVSMRFVEDAEGIAIGGRRAQDIRRRMRSVLNILQINLVDQHQHGPAMQGSSSSIITTRWETSSRSSGFANLVGRPTNSQSTPTFLVSNLSQKGP